MKQYTFLIWLLLLQFVLLQVCPAQNMYELSYQFYAKDKNGDWQKSLFYESLLFYYSENSEDNVIRCTYQTSQGKQIVEQKVKGQTWLGSDGKFNWRLSGVNPRYITTCGNSSGDTYYPDSFYFRKELRETDYRPVDVEDTGGGIAKVISFKPLTRAEVTNSYLSKWCWRWKDDTPEVCNLSASTLHLILVSNTTDYKLGQSFQDNHAALRSFFSDVAESCGMQFHPVDISGLGFNKVNVQATIRDFRAGANDVVIFYYSGHGFRYSNSTNAYPQMALRPNLATDLSSNTLNLNYDIYQPLIKKGGRLTLVIGECCNEDIGKDTPSGPDPASLPAAGNLFNTSTLKGLFCQHGNAIVATCSQNQFSWYYRLAGGLWRTHFLGALMNEVSIQHTGPASWQTIIDKANRETTQETTDSKDPVVTVQTPIKWIDIR